MAYYTAMKRVIFFLPIIALAGCMAGKPIEQMSYSEARALAQQIIKRCEAQGVKPGTREMKLCTDQEILREQSTRSHAQQMRDSIVVCNRAFNTVICN